MSTTLEAPKAPKWAVNTEVDDEGVLWTHPVATIASVGWISPGEVGLDAEVYVEQTFYTSDDWGGQDPAVITVEGGVESSGGGHSLHVTAPVARQLAHALLAAADVLDGPETPRDGSGGSTQYRITQVIRNHVEALPIGQNEIAVAAGYGTNELSELMTGKRRMDLEDVARIARALGMDPFDLFAEAAER